VSPASGSCADNDPITVPEAEFSTIEAVAIVTSVGVSFTFDIDTVKAFS
jgi:hypothetical protein